MILSKKVILIAEACDNHFGKIENAFKMVSLVIQLEMVTTTFHF